MRKILFVNDEMTIGGVAKILNQLIFMMDKEAYEIDLLVLSPRGELMNDIPHNVNVIHGTSFFHTVDTPLSLILKAHDIKRLFNKLRLIVYMKFNFIGARIKKERKKMLTKHYDVEFAAKEGFCTVFVANGNAKRKINWIQVDYKEYNYSKNHMSLLRKALSCIDMNIACSTIVNQSYRDVFGVQNVKTINNMIDLEKVHQLKNQEIEFEIDSNKINLITVARFHRQKGIDRLIEAFSYVKNQCNLYIIGDGELNEALHKKAKEQQVDHLIHWLGIKVNPYKYMSKMDLFVLSSLYEGYPTIVVESLTCGVPVLATKVAGIEEQILDNKNGMIVENSLEALVDALIHVANNKNTIKEWHHYLSEYHYPNEKILKELLEVINE